MKIYGSRDLGARLHQWHSGMDAVYGVGSMFYAGHGVTKERLGDALDILQRLYRFRKESRMPTADARHLSALIRDLKALKDGNYVDPEDLRDNPGTRSRRPARRASRDGFTVFLLDLDSYEGVAFHAKDSDTPEDAKDDAREWAERELDDEWVAAAMIEGTKGNPAPRSTGFTVFLVDHDSGGIAYYARSASSEKNAERLAKGWAERAIRDGYSIVGAVAGKVTPVHEDGGGVYCRLVNF